MRVAMKAASPARLRLVLIAGARRAGLRLVLFAGVLGMFASASGDAWAQGLDTRFLRFEPGATCSGPED